MNEDPKYCIIGAGSSGLAVAKSFLDQGIAFEVFEAQDEVGGNWYFGSPNSRVYRTTHLISSKPLTEYSDFPMPDHYPDYPGHELVLEYFKSYARHFNLYPHIRFNTRVIRAEKEGGQWAVQLSTGESRRSAGLVICNGHNWDLKWPDYPGEITCEKIHSGQYKDASSLQGKVVLVVGAGNSGCDIAVEAAQNARKTFHSTRRGYYYLPKFAFGRPSDQVGERFLRLGVPIAIRRLAYRLLLKIQLGSPQDYGLPRPDHRIFETHPIINSQIFYYLGQGDIIPKPDVREFRGKRVLFQDGSQEEVDLVIFATGYRISFPFLDPKYLNWQNGRPDLLLNIFHPYDDTLFVAGLIQPDSGQWGIVEDQAKLIAKFIRLKNKRPARQRLGRAAARRPKVTYLDSTRHFVEIEHYSYRRSLKRLARNLA